MAEDKKVEEITVHLEQTGIGNLINKRKPPGVTGSKILLRCNSFGLKWNVAQIHRYVVRFEPDIPAQDVIRRRVALCHFSQSLTEHYGVWVFDGTSILAIKHHEEGLQFSDETSSNSITVSHIKTIDTSDVNQLTSIEVNTIVNVILKKFLRILQLTKIGRNYFETKEPSHIPDYSITLFPGYSAAVEPTVFGLGLIVDAVHRVVKSTTVRALMDEIEQHVYQEFGHLPEAEQYKIIEKQTHEALSGASVLTRYNNALYRIDYVDWNRSAADTFGLRDGSQVSFAKYYADKYKCAIKNPKPGLLIHIPKKKRSDDDQIVLMPEFCHLTGLTDAERSNFRLMQALAQETRMEPARRLAHIVNLVKKIETSAEIKQQMDPLPFTVSGANATFEGRVLGPFKVTLKNQGREQKQDLHGDRSNFGNVFRECGMVSGVKIKKLIIVCNQPDAQLAEDLKYYLGEIAGKQGLTALLPEPELKILNIRRGERGQSIEQQWQFQVGQVIQQFNPDFLAAVIPDNPPSIYTAFKKVCTVTHPVLSQVVLTRNMKNAKKVRPVCGNVLKQILTKAGGIPWKIDINLPQASVPLNKFPSMIVGVDVCHDRKLGRSTVGFCASYSADFCQYNSFISFQKQGEEIVGASAELMKRALLGFGKHHPFPVHIVVYRDGVSNSQLDTVVRQEIMGYKQAFREVKQNYNPKLTVIVVQKRVSQRFFQASGAQASPTPGTVVDTQIVSPHFSDFFLVPCEAHPNAGTATPTRFIVVWDDCGFKTDDIQTMTNQFCFMYFNWPGPIRVPAPCMYAHKIAFLIGKHIPNEEPSQKLNGKLFYL